MTRWKNKNTGAIIETESILKGYWEKFIPEKNKVIQNETIEEELKNEDSHQEESDDLKDITIKDIKQELDALGIEYDPKAKKQELYELMMQGK